MWRLPLALALLTPALLVATACQSPLEEFVCTGDLQCGGAFEFARCEPSDHCSFFDPTCLESGFRFGESSGSESGRCVTGGAPIDLEVPVAVIGDLPIPSCDETELALDGSSSVVFGDAALVEFAWTIQHVASEELIDTFNGAPNALVGLDVNRRGGDFTAPLINLTPYHGRKALHGIVDSPGREHIFQDLDTETPLAPGTYQLFFAAAKNDALLPNEEFSVALRNGLGLTLQEETFSISPLFAPYRREITLSDTAPKEGPLALEFKFQDKGNYWIDNLKLINTATGEVVTRNDSVEDTLAPWLFGDGQALSPALEREVIPSELRKPGRYSIELVVLDSNDLASVPAVAEFVLPDCSE